MNILGLYSKDLFGDGPGKQPGEEAVQSQELFLQCYKGCLPFLLFSQGRILVLRGRDFWVMTNKTVAMQDVICNGLCLALAEG